MACTLLGPAGLPAPAMEGKRRERPRPGSPDGAAVALGRLLIGVCVGFAGNRLQAETRAGSSTMEKRTPAL